MSSLGTQKVFKRKPFCKRYEIQQKDTVSYGNFVMQLHYIEIVKTETICSGNNWKWDIENANCNKFLKQNRSATSEIQWLIA